MHSNKKFKTASKSAGNNKVDYKKYPLHHAAENNQVDVMRGLLKKEEGKEDVDVNAVEDINKETALHFAARCGHKEAVEFLLTAGANVNAKNKDNETPLYYASKHYYVEVANILLEKGADASIVSTYGYTPLHFWSFRGDVDMVKAVLAAGADTNISAKNKYNETPLHWASKRGHSDVVEILLGKGADVNIVSIYGYTPLHFWSFRGNINMVRAVLAAGAGASVNVINKHKETALHLASRRGHSCVVMILLAANASSLLKNDRNKTPVNLASNDEIERIFQNAEIELRKMQSVKIGERGISPIDIVLTSEANLTRYAYDVEVYRWLQGQFGCYDQLYKDLQQGQFGCYNWLIYAQYKIIRRMNLERDASEVIRFLRWKPLNKDYKEIVIADYTNIELERLIATNIDAIYKGETTPLCWAAAKGYREVEKYLLEKSAEVAQPNIQPNTQLDATQIAGVSRYLS
ncbi:ankyrin repeat domain-containing protein [Wolbachia endosymbiont of Pentalonia nigronervosa]|jgi:ankyrin repeat protein|uniref:ankyrin repeat domain-containing protein n=1 Tax=Wolbachia endosymbiont of Pentalonia nigronervosa TaxID=1301914 RepID=UPI00165FF318|nr:ankyrin repeat domain-containing protein [Wolbachia endosymbiont of Pentalonia nigronervosa]MBD0391596.1 ankyrin repeat domain-containing protein [Wolbachia endosymbiont of Pentalonia nigronervosa]